jgi:hypothetical protein
MLLLVVEMAPAPMEDEVTCCSSKNGGSRKGEKGEKNKNTNYGGLASDRGIAFEGVSHEWETDGGNRVIARCKGRNQTL